MGSMQDRRNRRVGGYAIALTASWCVLTGCSSPAGSRGDNSTGTSTGNGDGVGADGGSVDPTGTGNGTGGGMFGADPTGTLPTNSPTDGGCAAASHQAEQIVVETLVEVPVTTEVQVPVTTEVQVPVTTVINEPVAFYIMLDQSGSMEEQSGSTSKWDAAVSSITTFVNDPNSAGLDVAFNEFAGGITFLDFNCSGSQYANPLVAMGRLPNNAAPVVNALNNTGPTGLGTNIEPGLRAATDACIAHQQSTGEKCFVIFVSDGQPNVCSSDVTLLSSIAGNAYSQYGVKTFAVAMAGSDFNLMNQIAQAGGTDCDPNGPNYACDIQQNASAFIDALNQIRETTVVTDYITEIQTQYVTEYHTETQTVVQQEVVQTPIDCEWEIPPPQNGEVFDKNKINVQFSAGGDPQRIGYVPTAADCESAVGGWYYDDPTNPVKILVCAQTCSAIQSSTATVIDILVGCETEPAELR